MLVLTQAPEIVQYTVPYAFPHLSHSVPEGLSGSSCEYRQFASLRPERGNVKMISCLVPPQCHPDSLSAICSFVIIPLGASNWVGSLSTDVDVIKGDVFTFHDSNEGVHTQRLRQFSVKLSFDANLQSQNQFPFSKSSAVSRGVAFSCAGNYTAQGCWSILLQ